jgi:hypothetical protein
MPRALFLLAYAERSELSGPDWASVFAYLGALVAAVGLGLVPLAIAALRRRARLDSILVAALFWTIVAAGSGIATVGERLKWRRERGLLVASGYYDPATARDAPQPPLSLWGALAAAWAVLDVVALAGRRRGSSDGG